MSELADEKCVPCKGGTPPLTRAEIAPLAARLAGWRVVDDHHLERDYKTKDFASALALVNAIGAIAEEQGHHPGLLLAWGKVSAKIWTHKIDGLTESDFILAAKCDRAFAAMPASARR